jgi:hypothetical protein
MLPSSSRNSIMVLIDTHRIKHGVFGMENFFDFRVSNIITKESFGKHSTSSKQMSLTISYLFFGTLS